MNPTLLTGLSLHQLTGERNDILSVKVSGNWRVTFLMNREHAEIINYEDYHGKAGISPNMAVRLSIAFNTSSESWMSTSVIQHSAEYTVIMKCKGCSIV